MQVDHTIKHKRSSYWQETVTHATLSTNLPSKIDVAIIGGGLLGVATCYWLARAGVAAVLLERTMLADGATGRNGGFVSIGPAESYPDAIARLGHQTAHHVLKMTLENQMLLRQVLAEEDIDCEYREQGALSLACSEQHYMNLARDVATLQADGLAATLLDRQQAQELIRAPLGPEIIGGKFFPEQGAIHPIRLVQGLMKTSEHFGAQAYGATVVQIVPDNEGVLIHTEREALRAETVVVAANAWTSDILPSLAQLITPVRGQMLAYTPIEPIFRVGMSASITATGEYWQQTEDGTIVLGGCRAIAPGRDVGVRMSQPTAEVQTALENVLPRLFPSLISLQVLHRWAGLMAFTPDYLPIADQVPEMPGVWVVGGFSGHGMPFGMRVGQLVADAVISGKAPMELRPFRLNRATLHSHHNDHEVRRQQ